MGKMYTKLFFAMLALSPAIVFSQAGNVGINTANPGSTMDISGSLAAHYNMINTNSYNLTSSETSMFLIMEVPMLFLLFHLL